MKYTEADTASLAANVWPGLFRANPAKAIKKAIGLQEELEQMRSGKMKRVKTKSTPYSQTNQAQAYWVHQLSEIAKTHQTNQAQANPSASHKSGKPQATDLSRRVPYVRGIKEITGEKNWERALPKFKRFMSAKYPKDGEAEIRMNDHANRGFTVNQIIKYLPEYLPWWKQEKRKSARQSALAKKKRQGRVKRPKSDLRFKKNRKHKRGYCQECGKRVQQRERLCDEHLSGKPLLHTTKRPPVSEEGGRNNPLELIALMRHDAGVSRKIEPPDEDETIDEEGQGERFPGGLLKPEAMEEAYKDIYERLDGAD